MQDNLFKSLRYTVFCIVFIWLIYSLLYLINIFPAVKSLSALDGTYLTLLLNKLTSTSSFFIHHFDTTILALRISSILGYILFAGCFSAILYQDQCRPFVILITNLLLFTSVVIQNAYYLFVPDFYLISAIFCLIYIANIYNLGDSLKSYGVKAQLWVNAVFIIINLSLIIVSINNGITLEDIQHNIFNSKFLLTSWSLLIYIAYIVWNMRGYRFNFFHPAIYMVLTGILISIIAGNYILFLTGLTWCIGSGLNYLIYTPTHKNYSISVILSIIIIALLPINMFNIHSHYLVDMSQDTILNLRHKLATQQKSNISEVYYKSPYIDKEYKKINPNTTKVTW